MFYKKININGTEYPIATNISGSGAPTVSTEGVVGMFYMDEDTNRVYKCSGQALNGDYIWTVLAEAYDFIGTIEEPDKSGYIVLSLPAASSAQVLISQSFNTEECISQFRIYCGGDVHSPHSLYVDCEMPNGVNGTVPVAVYTEGTYSNCRWYIPIKFDYSTSWATVRVKGITNEVSGVSITFSETAPEQNIYPSTINVPVTSADNGKFMRVVNGKWTAVALTNVSEEGA